jgi:hypothetical protein
VSEARFLAPTAFANEFGYGHATIKQKLEPMREAGVAFGRGKMTRIDVEKAKHWLTHQRCPTESK